MSEELEKDLIAFQDQFSEVLETYKIQNAKYGSDWKTCLDARAMFVEINAKICRLKKLVWSDWDTISNQGQRARAVETCNDTILYLAMLAQRLERDIGPIDRELVKKMVDST